MKTETIEARLEAVALEDDPENQLRLLAEISADAFELGRDLRARKRDVILELRRRGRTWPEIGRILGASPQRAHELSRT